MIFVFGGYIVITTEYRNISKITLPFVHFKVIKCNEGSGFTSVSNRLPRNGGFRVFGLFAGTNLSI